MAATLACLLLAWPAAAGGDLLGQSAPDFTLKSLAGENLRLSEYRGSVVLLTFWAPWCGECREQLPQLNAVQARFRGAGLQVLSIGIDQHVHRVADMARGLQLDYPVLVDPGNLVARLYDPRELPFTLLLDPAGNVRHVHGGFRRDDARVYAAELERLLADFGPLNDQG